MRLTFFLILCFNYSFLQQIQAQSPDAELISITQKYQLSTAQQLRVKQLITSRDQDLSSIDLNTQFDELQRAQKRSSIRDGFENSIKLLLNEDQSMLSSKATLELRKERAAIIEQMKKSGHSQAEILEYLNKQTKVESIHE